mgnify:CR=1 FL=1
MADKLLISDGTCAKIKSVMVATLESLETTYNFEVEDFHTYYVSNSNVLVHNRCKLGKNMIKEGQTLSSNEDAHHLFPQKTRDKF